MKICFRCKKPIDEEADSEYVMIISKRKGKIIEFVCFHFDCLQEHLNDAFIGDAKEKMNKCKVCGKKIRFWDSYMEEGGYFCKECWDKKVKKLEEAREKEEKELVEKSMKKDDSVNDSQKTL